MTSKSPPEAELPVLPEHHFLWDRATGMLARWSSITNSCFRTNPSVS